MITRQKVGRRPIWGMRNGLLWLLAAALGAAAISSMATAIHDTERQNRSGRLILRATDQQIESNAAARLEAIALQTFAPVTPWLTRVSLAPRPALEALAREQRAGEQCRCREMLPASDFFRFDVAGGSLERVATDRRAAESGPTAAMLSQVARNEVSRATSWNRRQSPSHFVASKALGDIAVVTFTQFDSGGKATVVYGVVANARETAAAIFGSRAAGSVGDSLGGIVHLDSLSLQVATTDSLVLFGALPKDRTMRAFLHPTTNGPLGGLTISLALHPHQVASSLLEFVPHQLLWHIGFLQLGTVLMIAIAIASTRREVLLARARSDFVAGVSHDLRMPLAQILIASETLTLQRERDEKQRLELAGSIVRETRRLIALVENVLFFSRSGAVELRPQITTVSVGALFDDVIESVQLAVADARQTIDVQEGASLAVLADRPLVRQALANLVDNALKYGIAGQHIHLGAIEHAGGLVRLYVDDQGPGVPRSQRKTVFDAYQRLARDQTSERTGTGLGLAVVRNIVEACGGRVWLDDAPGGGTRAVIELRASMLVEPSPRALEPV
jgi:signal transduction histidine kinase